MQDLKLQNAFPFWQAVQAGIVFELDGGRREV